MWLEQNEGGREWVKRSSEREWGGDHGDAGSHADDFGFDSVKEAVEGVCRAVKGLEFEQDLHGCCVENVLRGIRKDTRIPVGGWGCSATVGHASDLGQQRTDSGNVLKAETRSTAGLDMGLSENKKPRATPGFRA